MPGLASPPSQVRSDLIPPSAFHWHLFININRVIRPPIPNNYLPGSITAMTYLSLESSMLDIVILYLDGKPFMCGIQ